MVRKSKAKTEYETLTRGQKAAITRKANKEEAERKAKALHRRQARLAKKAELEAAASTEAAACSPLTTKAYSACTPTYEEASTKQTIGFIDIRLGDLEYSHNQLKGLVKQINDRITRCGIPVQAETVASGARDEGGRKIREMTIPVDTYEALKAENEQLKQRVQNPELNTKWFSSRATPSRLQVQEMIQAHPNWAAVWATADGRDIKVAELSNGHLRNILALLIRRREERKSEFQDVVSRADKALDEVHQIGDVMFCSVLF
jgi:hypothetical protein